MRPIPSFVEEIYSLVERIPRGRVMTYGQIATLCGHPMAARVVGQVAHWGPPQLPWQRVVHWNGLLASGFSCGGYEAHKQLLEAEGVAVDRRYRVDLNELLWWPSRQLASSHESCGCG